MSFLSRSQPIRLIQQAARSATPYGARQFAVSSIQNKGVIDTTKDVLKTVDRKVSDKLVDGFEVAGKITFPARLPSTQFPYHRVREGGQG